MSMDEAALRKTLAEIERDRAETRKLQREMDKLASERLKLDVERRNYERRTWWHPLAVTAGIFAAGGGFTLLILRLGGAI